VKPVRLHSLARAEVREAVDYYDAAREGLGDDFADAVEAAIARIGSQPRAGAPHKNGYRKVRVSKRFPYMIFYYEYADHVWVASVYHGSREPDAWTDRTPENGNDE
jgi:plasmid stabilization system protein ParE